MVNTRVSRRGRSPSLRDQILALLHSKNEGMTIREIAEEVHRDETTPFRPLKDLQHMGLVFTDETDHGTAYFVDNSKYEEFRNNSKS